MSFVIDSNSVTVTDSGEILGRAMLCYLSIGVWTARRYDKDASDKIASFYGAIKTAGRYNKLLLPTDCPSYKSLLSLAGTIRTEHYKRTLAWLDDGRRVLPTAEYMDYAAFIRQSKSEFHTLLNEFLPLYPDLKLMAITALNGLAKDEDYPSVSQVKRKFHMSVDYSPLPASGDFRLDLPAEEIQRIQSESEARGRDAVQSAVRDMWSRLHDVVGKVRDKLTDPDGIFRDTLIENVREQCTLLAKLNFTGDPDLERMRQEVSECIAQTDPDTIRKNASYRQDVALLADDIYNRMAGFYQPTEE